MYPRVTRRFVGSAIGAACCALVITGCASWQTPRIDPSGERLFLWPNQPAMVPAVAAPVGAPVVAPPFTTAPPATSPFGGNIQAAPVYSDLPAAPLVPGVPAGISPAPFIPGAAPPPVITVPQPGAAVVPTSPTITGAPIAVTSPTSVTAAVPVALPGVATPLGTAAPLGHDYVRVTPDRILAPVGSEVVLKAGICTAKGYLLANQRVEWLLASGDAGQFVDVAERDQVSVFRWLADTPRKLTNSYAIGATSAMPVCLQRGTPDPNDDVQIVKGDAWISVTSATEGTSHVTAYSPTLTDWNLRRATATIYWVDAQWTLPPSAVAEAGRPHILTTTVARRTDGAPLPGWLVRYESGGGATLGYEGGGVVEVATDANGRASVEVAPSSSGGGTTTVGVTIVRPPQVGPDVTPRLEIGRGAATITWATGVPATPAPVAPFTDAAPLAPTPQPTLPDTTPPIGPYSPPTDEPPAGRPQLEIRLERRGAEQVAVGEYASFALTVINRGDGTARGIDINSRFDPGLRHERAEPNVYAITYRGMRDLPPSESETIPLTFQVVAAGPQCQDVTVTAQGAEPVAARGCVTVSQPALAVVVTGPRSRDVGQLAEFRTVVKNDGEAAASDVVIVMQFEPGLEPKDFVSPDFEHDRRSDGAIVIRVAQLAPATSRTIRLNAECIAPSMRACTRVVVNAAGGATAASEACVEIRTPLPAGGGGAAAPTNLQLTVTESANPVRSGQRSILYVTVRNTGQQVERQVRVRVLMPVGMAPDMTQIQPQGAGQLVGTQEIQFAPIAELPPLAERQYVIPVTVGGTGTVQYRAELAAASLSAPIVTLSNPIAIQPPAP